jgi:hypothetical protein
MTGGGVASTAPAQSFHLSFQLILSANLRLNKCSKFHHFSLKLLSCKAIFDGINTIAGTAPGGETTLSLGRGFLKFV